MFTLNGATAFDFSVFVEAAVPDQDGFAVWLERMAELFEVLFAN